MGGGLHRADVNLEVLRDVLQELPFASLFKSGLDLIHHRGDLGEEFVYRTPFLRHLLHPSRTALEGVGGHVGRLAHRITVDVLDDVADL